jgi:hypothetical protein
MLWKVRIAIGSPAAQVVSQGGMDMSTYVQREDKSDSARSRRPILSAARTLMLGLGKRAFGAMVWYVNVDGKDEREALSVRSRCATRDLVREAMINYYELDRHE